MAVREENVARTPASVKGYATDCGAFLTATTGAGRFRGRKPKTAIVEFPVVSFPQGLPGGCFDRTEIVGALCFPNPLDKGSAEHFDPIGQPGFAVFQFGGAVEQACLTDLETVAFEQGGIFSDSRVVPGIRALARDTEPAQALLQCGDHVFYVPLAAKLCDESSAGFERAGDARHHRFCLGNPVQRGIGKHRVEFLSKLEGARVANLEPESGKLFARFVDHVRRTVHAHNNGSTCRDFGGKLACSTPDIENSLTVLR